ncbi:MAG: Hsp33 family molecular chaperone HslO [Pacificimonas sp.]
MTETTPVGHAVHAPSPEDDRILGFTVPLRAGRGRLIRLGDTLEAILAAHDYPEVIAKTLGEAVVLTAMLGAALRGDGGQTTVQARAENGAIGLIVCDYRAGEIRGYVQVDAGKLADLPKDPDLPTLFGKGYLAVTLDPVAGQERYQGIVPLEGDSLSAAFQNYFTSSEQIPTILRAHVRRGARGWHAGGLLLQHLPRGEQDQARLDSDDAEDVTDEDWAHLAALGATVSDAELTDPDLSLEDLTWRLFNEDEVRVTPATPLSRGCRCSVAHIEERLGLLPEEQKVEIRDDDGKVRVDCEFCARQFEVVL